MFDNISLFTKIGNQVQEPNSSWTNKTTIHCAFELNLGFGTDKVIWGTGNSLKLRELIDFFVELNQFARSIETSEVTFEFKNNDTVYIFSWIKEENSGIQVKVYLKRYNSTTFILQKAVGWDKIIQFKRDFLVTVIGILSEKTNNEFSSAVGELFFETRSKVDYEFRIGQRVQTIVGQNVKTERIGVIIDKSYHDKDQTTMYQLWINGKIATKRYFPADLRLTD